MVRTFELQNVIERVDTLTGVDVNGIPWTAEFQVVSCRMSSDKTSPTQKGRAVLFHWVETNDTYCVERTWMNIHIQQASFDIGSALHHLLAETFGQNALQPFRLFIAPTGTRAKIYAYSPSTLKPLQILLRLPHSRKHLRLFHAKDLIAAFCAFTLVTALICVATGRNRRLMVSGE